MNQDAEINIHAALDFLRDHAPVFAKAKADRVFLEEWRKSKKALLMRQAEADGHKTGAAQEREAYSHPEYLAVLDGLRVAVETEETLRWRFVAAQAKISAWQTIEATRRIENKTFG